MVNLTINHDNNHETMKVHHVNLNSSHDFDAGTNRQDSERRFRRSIRHRRPVISCGDLADRGTIKAAGDKSSTMFSRSVIKHH